MVASKIKMRVGDIEVEYEGSDTFLEKKLPSLISKLAEMAGCAPPASNGEGTRKPKKSTRGSGEPGTLAAFLKASNAGTSKTKRFLATAVWLHQSGQQLLNTGDVVAALKSNHQPAVGNASQCLNNNVTKGYCEKDGKQFFVTPEGHDSLE